MREFVNAIFYVPSAGHHWQAIPKDLPSKSTVWGYFFPWELEGTIARIHHALYFAVRERAGRVVRPTIAIIDSQTAKLAQKAGPPSTHRATAWARGSSVTNAMFRPRP